MVNRAWFRYPDVDRLAIVGSTSTPSSPGAARSVDSTRARLISSCRSYEMCRHWHPVHGQKYAQSDSTRCADASSTSTTRAATWSRLLRTTSATTRSPGTPPNTVAGSPSHTAVHSPVGVSSPRVSSRRSPGAGPTAEACFVASVMAFSTIGVAPTPAKARSLTPTTKSAYNAVFKQTK